MRPAPEQLAELWEELSRGRIVEATVTADDCHIEGLTVYGSDMIYLNPAPALVECLLHELLHRRYPSWSERRVDQEAKRMMGHLKHSDVAKWYRAYQRRKTKRKTTVRAAV